MNVIVKFRKCTLSDNELIDKIDSMTDEIFQNGEVPSMNIPTRPDKDYDLLIGELLLRFKELKDSRNEHISHKIKLMNDLDLAEKEINGKPEE